MKNIMHKTTWREIKGSFGRWAAILAIVALGVGFFCGLKMCKEDFMKTGDDYVLRQNFYNYKLITTLGLEEEDVAIIADVEGVKSAAGSWSSDALILVEDAGDAELVSKFHTILADMNQLDLKAGTLPSAGNQLVGDHRYFSEEDLGKTITLTSTNDDDTLDLFAYEEYELVGLAASPEYLNQERGTTSLGSGTVSCFCYIPAEGWDSDVYTEIYVDFEEDYTIFSDEYIAHDDIMEARLEDAMDQCGERRYDSVISEARQTLADAEAEVNDAEAELNDGKKKLADGKKELADGKKELEDGKKELADGQKELTDNRKKLEDAKLKLEDGRKKLLESRQEIEDAKKQVVDGRAEYENGLAQFEEQKEAAYSQINQALAAGYMNQAMYDAQKAQIDLQLAPAQAELDAARQELELAEAEIADGEKKIADAEKELSDAEKEISDGEKKLEDGEAELADARRKIADAAIEIAEAELEIADAESEIADGEKKIADARKELRDAEKEIDDIEYPTTYVLGRDANVGYACFESDSSIVDSVSRVFPIFFILIAALICMTTMTRMIDEQRTQIGVLKALGYRRGQIMSKYVIYSGSAAALGSVFGFFVGIHLFPWIIWWVYGLMYGFADIIFQYNWILGGICLAVSMLCCVGTTIFSCSAELKEVPAQLIRPKAPQAGKRIWMEYLPFIWNKLSFLVKVSIRNTFRYRRRFIMMVIGISGCTALLITGLGVKDSIGNVVTAQYDQIYHIDYTVSFQKDMKEKDQNRFLEEAGSVMKDCLFVYTGSADARANGYTKALNMIVSDAPEEMTKYVSLYNDDGPISWPETGKAVITHKVGHNMGLSVGDILYVYDSDMNEMTVEIAAFCDNYVNSYLYLNRETFEEAWGPMETNAAIVLGISGEDGKVADPYKDSTVLLDARHVSAVSVTEDFRGQIDTTLESMNYIILLIVACAGALAFIVLYNLTNINITERIREIATIKVLGFYSVETAQYVFRENILLTAIAAVVGMPLGKALHAFVMSQVTVDMLAFDMYIRPISYVIGVIITFLFAFLVNLVMQKKLSKISMTESLKSIE